MPRPVLVLNAGSSSVKFAVAKGQNIFLRGEVDHFGKQARITFSRNGRVSRKISAVQNLHAAFAVVGKILHAQKVVPSIVAHRIVHGGQKLSKPTKLTPAVVQYLHKLIELAPLHQPANLMGVAFAKKTWPKATEWGVFDTALYRALPVKVRTYALPRALTARLHIEKYGFHGLAHDWAFHQAATKLKISPRRLSAVTVHLGSGASMTLWKHGRPIDTTMGFTPLEGLVMATRSGDIDPAIPLYIQEKLRWSPKKVEHVLEQHAGLLGLSGLSDMRDVLSAAGHHVPGWPRHRWTNAAKKKATLALNVYMYHVRKTLAGYIGMSQVKAIVFSGPIGTNKTIQSMILHDLPAARGIKYLSVPADEEQAIVAAVRP